MARRNVLFLLLVFATVARPTMAGGAWLPTFSQGANGAVFAMTTWNGNLVIGGSFSIVAGVPAANVARWDGSRWHALGSGVDGIVLALGVDGPDLVVGGEFTLAGGAGANRIARWNGVSWQPYGAGLASRVWTIGRYANQLVAGYDDGAARWTGSSWVNVTSLGNSYVLALLESGGALYIGGNFTQACGQPHQAAVIWNGVQCLPLGAGVEERGSDLFAQVYAFEPIAGGIAVAGRFDTAGGQPAASIARWDGAAWHPLGAGLTGAGGQTVGITVWDLEIYAGQLIATGTFTEAGGAPMNRIAAWNGQSWLPLGAGLGGTGLDLEVWGDLYVGGGFVTAGGQSAQYIAHWQDTATPPVGRVPDRSPGQPLLLQKTGGHHGGVQLTLTWGSSCSPGDDYAIYEGPLGSFDQHVPVACSTGGAMSASIALASPDAYYLVVAVEGSAEGSYGLATAGERPPSSTPCASYSPDECP